MTLFIVSISALVVRASAEAMRYNRSAMNLAGIRWTLIVLLAATLTGCASVRPVSPPPDFAAPIVRAPLVVLPAPAPDTPSPLRSRQVPGVVGGRVVIDAGHGGKDPGAQIPGINEKTINLAVSRLVAKKLSARGITVVLTRNSDVFIQLADRAASGSRADLFVSIHADSNPSPDRIGHSILLPQSGDRRATLAARYIDRQMTAAGSPSYNVRPDSRGLLVLRQARCPAILVELGYLSNRIEAARLRTAAYQEQLAQGIANGIIDFLGDKR